MPHPRITAGGWGAFSPPAGTLGGRYKVHLCWQGEGCLLKSPGGEITYEFQSEHFDAANNLVAKGESLDDLSQQGSPNAKLPQLKELTLTRNAAGKYAWVPSK